jgi:organic radical activating enzyme
MCIQERKEYSLGRILPIAETFYSLQGEGYNVGKPAFFIRLCGCNVKCSFCDSKNTWDMHNAQWLSIEDLLSQIEESKAENVVVTGGEPLLHNLNPLCELLHSKEKKLWLETSASLPFSGKWDWVCISPKAACMPLETNYAYAHELKIVISTAEDLLQLPTYIDKVNKETHLYLQAEWDKRKEITPLIIEHIKTNPRWTLSLQTHKWLGIE